MNFNTCDLYDQYGAAARVLNWMAQDFGGCLRFAGEVETVKCFEDNGRVKELASTPGNGRVLVVDGGGSNRTALVGDMIAASALQSGWAGLIINGCVRDKAALAGLNIGIKALGTTPRTSVRRGEGTIGIAVEIGGVRIQPGDRLFADEDGILILDPSG